MTTIPVPISPKGVDAKSNIQMAKLRVGHVNGPSGYYWFFQMVKNNGSWDYKQKGSQYQDFGNFNYGAVGYAIGIPETVLLRAAGWAQSRAGTSLKAWGIWWDKAPYGDDPQDQIQIKAGINYAKHHSF